MLNHNLTMRRAQTHEPHGGSTTSLHSRRPSNVEGTMWSSQTDLAGSSAAPDERRPSVARRISAQMATPFLAMVSKAPSAGRVDEETVQPGSLKNLLSVDNTASLSSGFMRMGSHEWDVFTSDEEEEEIDLEETPTARVKKTLVGEDYTVYVLALRCFLRPFLEEAQSTSAVKKFLHNLSFGGSGDNNKAKKLSKADLRRLQEDVASQAEAELKKADGDRVLASALQMFAGRMEIDGEVLVDKGKNTSDDFAAIFSDILRMEMRRTEKKVDEDTLQARLNAFAKNLRTEQGAKKQHRRAQSDTGRLGGFGGGGGMGGGGEVYVFGAHHTALARAFGVKASEHSEAWAREQRINDDAVLAEELRLRLAGLDSHEFYNASTLIGGQEAYVRQRQRQEEDILHMLRAVDPTAKRKFSVMPPPEATMNTSTDSGVGDELAARGGEFVVGVIRARGLLGKDKGGTSNAYCVVEVGGDKMRTNTVKKSCAPIWREACSYDIRPKDDNKPVTFTLTVAHEEDEGSRNLIRALMDKDDTLGTLTATVGLDDLIAPLERWYPLQKKSKKGSVGEVFLRLEYKSNRRRVEAKREEEQRKREEEARRRAEEEAKRVAQAQEASSKRPALPNYHRIYDQLFAKVYGYELRRYQRRKTKTPTATIPLITRTYLRLLDEFGMRYGVGHLYRWVVLIRHCARSLALGEIDIEAFTAISEALAPDLRVGEAGFTHEEWNMLEAALNDVEGTCIGRLSHYKDYFPYATPRNHLRLHLRALARVYNLAAYREQNVHAKSIHAVVHTCIETCCKLLYSRYYAMTAPLSISPTRADIAKQIGQLVECVTRELEGDAFYFRHDFAAPGAQWVDVVGVAVPAMTTLLATDIECMLLEHFDQQRFCPEALSIYHRLKKFNDRVLALWAAADQQQGAFQGLALWELWGPHVGPWLEGLRAQAGSAVDGLAAHEDWLPVSSQELHSHSATKVLAPMLTAAEFLVNLEWEDAASQAAAMATYAKAVSSTVQAYMAHLHRQAYTFVLGAPRTQHDYFIVPPQVCVVLNNGETLRHSMQLLCAVLHCDHIAAPLEEDAGGKPRATADTSGWELELSVAVTGLASTQTSITTLLVAQLGRDIGRVLGMLASEGGVMGRARRMLPAAWATGNTGESGGSGNLVDSELRPLVMHLTTTMLTLQKALYLSVYYKVLLALWNEVLHATESVLLSAKYTHPTGLQLLDTALQVLWECLHASGEGLGKDMWVQPRARTVREVMQALRTCDGERLVALHTFCQDDRQAADFLVGVMRSDKSRTVQDYLRLLR